MQGSLGRIALTGAMLCLTGGLASAQTTTSSSETKRFEVIAAAGNDVVVQLPEGTRELTVPDSFRFTVDGQQLSVHDLKAGMTGTAIITTRVQTTPVTVTEVKNGTVVMASGPNLYVRSGNDVKMFTQGDIDKRGVNLMRDGKPAKLTDYRTGDQISATIVTTKPPKVVTEREVQAVVNRAAAPAAPAPRAAAAPAAPTAVQGTPALSEAPPAPAATIAQTLPKTAGSLPLLSLIGLSSLILAAGLTLRRFRQQQ
jgi:LPXTG-motif cell wall-anchored protein